MNLCHRSGLDLSLEVLGRSHQPSALVLWPLVQSFQPFLHFCNECVLRLPLYSCDLAQRKEIEPLLKLRFASGIVSKFGEVFVLNI